MIPASWLPLAARGREFTQPGDPLLVDPCTYRKVENVIFIRIYSDPIFSRNDSSNFSLGKPTRESLSRQNHFQTQMHAGGPVAAANFTWNSLTSQGGQTNNAIYIAVDFVVPTEGYNHSIISGSHNLMGHLTHLVNITPPSQGDHF